MSRAVLARAVPTEHEEQCAVIAWAALLELRYPALKLLMAIPNGGHRHKAVAGKLRAEGVRRGVPDLFLPVPSQYDAGLWIELKRVNAPPSAVSPEQHEWHVLLRDQGYRVVVCRGAASAIEAITHYLSIPFGAAAPAQRPTHDPARD